MKPGRLLKILILALCLCIAAGAGIFLYNAHHSYNIKSGFAFLPLKFDPDDSSSSFSWNGTNITVHNGFVKGIQKGTNKSDALVIRALSPMPSIELSAAGNPSRKVTISIENIDPELYAKNIKKGFNPARTAVNTLEFTIGLNPGEKISIKPDPAYYLNGSNYVILGDSRDGYETFSRIIDQVNALKPLFAVDNGDLVYNGKPNQYRVFDRMISGFSTTICTVPGNHDIRDNGRETYTKLYGPGYYSFDIGSNHFCFVDSSPGWEQKQAVSNEQYAWLERDLKKAQGKWIFVITHIPPVDPRSGAKSDEVTYYIDKIKPQESYFEQKLDEFEENASMNHGFHDKQEAERFKSLMTKYKVGTVYLSHIHSYFDYTENGVRYIISGGAGAELLTKDSYYHYLVTRLDGQGPMTMIQLPSPPNVLLKRYITTAAMFLKAIYKENTIAVIFFTAGLLLLVLLIIVLISIKLNRELALLWILLKDSSKYTSKRFRELFKEKH